MSTNEAAEQSETDAPTDGRSLRAARRRAATQQQILEAAEEVIHARGFPATSVADIIEAAGVARGTFYQYFESREAVFYRLMEGFTAELRETVTRVRMSQPDPVGAVEENLRRVFDLLLRRPAMTMLLFRDAVLRDEALERTLDILDGHMQAMAQGALEKGAQAGLIRPVEPETTAAAILGAIRGVAFREIRRGEADPERAPLLAREIFQLVYRGLRGEAAVG